jgi:hypothetical protein
LTSGNNCFAYGLTISATDAPSSPSKPSDTIEQPGVSPLPDSAADLVIRPSNVESGLNEAVRVQNEVAMMMLTREALASLETPLVPVVYGWAPGDTGMGWTLCQRLPGELLSDKFDSLEKEAKKDVISQIAQILKLIQTYQLPRSITDYGGLAFDQDGSIVNGPTAIPGGGPCQRHADLYAEYLQTQVDLSKKCGIIQGWEGTDLPARIGKARDRLADTAEWEKSLRPTLVHADFGKSEPPARVQAKALQSHQHLS